MVLSSFCLEVAHKIVKSLNKDAHCFYAVKKVEPVAVMGLKV
jgi:hypothetical protein